ncbi:START-like domain-containing protein [Mediterranea massiliensis]|uniref:START-like domain-containing protein n=1 Tax=Mediterranea massiliensis TaxID=1841865 RepID=UPI0025A4938C|nr:START-like domain-containing protein [Mediterranea massiliensis]MDM8337498.1 START-like domain-containing protein [Mediterranea massiliensis]
MERQKVHLEYLLNATSKSILWTAISTPSGLEGWFADRVQSDNKHVTFFWGKTEKREADIVALRAYSFIRFKWRDVESAREYFELKMTNSELTNDFVLEITDFADVADVADVRELWDSQVETLRRTCGF